MKENRIKLKNNINFKLKRIFLMRNDEPQIFVIKF